MIEDLHRAIVKWQHRSECLSFFVTKLKTLGEVGPSRQHNNINSSLEEANPIRHNFILDDIDN